MAEFTIWMEGFQVTGNSEKARPLNTTPIEADSFNEAVRIYAEQNPNSMIEEITRKSFKTDEEFKNKRSRWHIWGCRLFSNEFAARKTHG